MKMGLFGRAAAVRVFLPALVCAASVAQIGTASGSTATTTSGGVNWLDPLSYTKPAFVPITVPDETTVANKYYIDLTAGSGSSCTQSAPCKDFSSLAGKPGTTGGPAYIYLRGSGRLNLTGTLYGATGSEIVIEPWPGATQLVTMSNDGSGTTAGANIISGTGVHHVILDGGPNLLFEFTSKANSGQNGYVLIVSSNDITVARSRMHQPNGAGPIVGHAAGGGTWSRVRYINNEIYDNVTNLTGAAYGFYLGGGATCSPPSPTTGFDDLTIENNIIRNIAGNAIMGEPRGLTANRTTISGNAIHTVGKGQNRTAISLTDACSGSFNTVSIYNNIFFDLWEGAMEMSQGFPSTLISNNTIFNFAQDSNATLECHGITSVNNGDVLTVDNNIVLKSNNGTCLYVNRNSGWISSNNLCGSGCELSGSATSVFQSTSSSDPSFLAPIGTSVIATSGLSLLTSGISMDYLGVARTASSFGIGAIGTSGGVFPDPPTNVVAQ